MGSAQRGHSQLDAGRSLLLTGPRQLSLLTATAARGAWPSMPLHPNDTTQPPCLPDNVCNCLSLPCWGFRSKALLAQPAKLPGAVASACALANAAGSTWPSCKPAPKFCPPKYERDGLSPLPARDFDSKALLSQHCHLGCVVHSGHRCLIHPEGGPHRHAQHVTSQRRCSRGQQCLHMCSAQEWGGVLQSTGSLACIQLLRHTAARSSKLSHTHVSLAHCHPGLLQQEQISELCAALVQERCSRLGPRQASAARPCSERCRRVPNFKRRDCCKLS